MKLSVVIPTHNRAALLKTCLERVFSQEGVPFEVLVVDDGSTDETESVVSRLTSHVSNLTYLKQPPTHQGTARNRGAEAATGDVIVFIGDDIFVEPGFLKAHRDRHLEHPDENVAVLGFSTWDPALAINPYMLFLEKSGWQFGYGFLKPGFVERPDPYKFFYTSNLSLKRYFFLKEKFDEEFKVYGWEDIELGYRLWKRHGLRLFYESEARAFHHHFMDENDLPRRMRAVGASAVHFERLHPEAAVVPRGLKGILIRFLSRPFLMPFWRFLGRGLFYKFKCWQAFFEGVDS